MYRRVTSDLHLNRITLPSLLKDTEGQGQVQGDLLRVTVEIQAKAGGCTCTVAVELRINFWVLNIF